MAEGLGLPLPSFALCPHNARNATVAKENSANRSHPVCANGRPMRIEDDTDGPLEITERTTITAIVTGAVYVAAGAELRLAGQVNGDVTVRRGGALIMTGTVKGAVINEGGAVDIFGFAGRVEDRGDTETMVSRGAIIGGKRSVRAAALARFQRT